jgi:UDP-N-acetylglucosamine 2-epimerase (non-hydrolysing)
MLLIAYGTRPEWLKLKPVIDALKNKKIKFRVLFTGQHVDIAPKDADHLIDLSKHNSKGVDRLNFVLSKCIEDTAKILSSSPEIKQVMVQGDTTSALGVAMAAYNVGVKVIHLEAGLRTYDLNNPFPEEANRQLISRIAAIHLCPTHYNNSNLDHEIVGGKRYVVGNTALDNLHPYLAKCEYDNKILVTLHRRENHDIIADWFQTINQIAGIYKDHEFVLPLHPNPNVRKHVDILTNVKVVEPLSHQDLLNILVKCKFVITDSGGIQEECSFLGKKAIVCRKETERPEAIGHTTQLCESPAELKSMVFEMMEKYELQYEHQCPFGDGQSAKKIVKILKDIL